MLNFAKTCPILLGLCLSCPALSQVQTPAEAITAYIDNAGSLAWAQRDASGETREIVRRCKTCHGPNGNSQKPDNPNLAQQQPLYLLKQLVNFSSRKRKSRIMHAMIKGLDMSHFVPLSLHFSGQTLDPLPDLEVTTNLYGKELFARRCQHCHSIDAMGQAGIPRLAGQQPIYIKGQLKNFRSGNEKRKHFGMAAITKDLTDEQINNLITHLSGLNQ